MGITELFAVLGGLGVIGYTLRMGMKQTQRRKEMEHSERVKALEMGLVPRPGGLDWAAAATCIALGAGVPVGTFLVTWLAVLTTEVGNGIWAAPVIVSLASIDSARKLAYRVLDPKSGPCKNKRAAGSTSVKDQGFDPDAYDVVGSRG